MGNCVGGFKSRAKKTRLPFRKTRKIYLCVLGIDGAGKSTFIRAIASEDINGVLPTNGFTLSEFKHKNTDIVAYDLGGGERIRAIWRNYYSEVFGSIYVIDGSDESRLNESNEALKSVISDENMRTKPMLILVNKKDRVGCVDEIQISDRFRLHDLANMYATRIRVEVCAANQGSGNAIDEAIKDGFDWLLERIFDEYDRLEKGVNEALKVLKQKQEEERMRRQHRLAASANSASTSMNSRPGSEHNSRVLNDNDTQATTNASHKTEQTNSQLLKKMERRNCNFRKWSRNQVAPLPQTPDDPIDGCVDNGLTSKRSRLPSHLPPLQLSNANENTTPDSNATHSRRVSTAGAGDHSELVSSVSNRIRSPIQIIPLTSLPPVRSGVNSAATKRFSLSRRESA